jgi:hypothetical protein
MKFLKNLFKKKEAVKVEPVEEDNVPKNFCEYCEEQLWEKGKQFGGKRYHIKCFRKMKKEATKAVFQA